MQPAAYQLESALVAGEQRPRSVIVGPDGTLHRTATAWLYFLQDTRSPNTVQSYGRKVAWYLSWTAQTADWRSVGVSHLAMWRHTVEHTPVLLPAGKTATRKAKTVRLWMTAVRSFYEYAEAHGALLSDVATRMTEVKYFSPGSPGGGEYGATRRVLISELKPSTDGETDIEWIDDPDARAALECLELNARDRFIVDLLYGTGVRAGEALSLFRADMHLGGGKGLGCHMLDPHFHVRTDNPVENGERAKGTERTLPAMPQLIESYTDYLLARQKHLGDNDRSPHLLINLWTPGPRRGEAMTYKGMLKMIKRCGDRIGFPLSGPHLLRHTLATRLVRGIDCEPQPLDVVQSLLGHRSITSTRAYTHDLEAAKKTALSSLRPRALELTAR
jgi:integrase/recombinase XerD